jgi:hypothetical protein
MTRLSCHRFQANEVLLWLSVIAYHTLAYEGDEGPEIAYRIERFGK